MYLRIMTKEVGVIVSGRVVHRKMLFRTVEFNCMLLSLSVVFCRYLISITRLTLQAAITIVVMTSLREGLTPEERCHATRITIGRNVTALLLDRNAKTKATSPAMRNLQLILSRVTTKSITDDRPNSNDRISSR